jgi:hypothetical protein
MRKWILGLASASVLLLAAAAFAGALFFARPELLLTGRSIGAAIKFAGKAYAPRWASLRFAARAIGRRRHRYTLDAADFCFADPRGSFSACFSELELSVVVLYTRHGPVVESVERLVAVSADARFDARNPPPRSGGFVAPAALRSASVRSLRVELSSFAFITEKTEVSGSLRANLVPGARRPLSIAADARIRGSSDAWRLKTELTASTDLLEGGKPSFIDLVGRADLGPRGRARAAFRVRREPLRWAASGGVELIPPDGPLKVLRLTACEGSAPLRPGAARPSGADLSCRWEAVPSKRAPEPFGSIASATGRASLSAGLDGERYRAALKATLDPIKVWCEIAGDLALGVAGRLDRPLKEAAVTHELRAAVKVARFEDLVAFLRNTKFSVPAPVHVLSGPLALSVSSRGDPRDARRTARYSFSSDLAGGRQRLVLRGEGELTAVNPLAPGRAFEHSGQLILKEVALELPRLDVGRAPKVLVDRRIRTGDEAPAVPVNIDPPPVGVRFPPVRGSLSVKTEKPLLLFSNLAKDPVPAALDLVLTFPPASVGGLVAVRKFNVELFRRNATVDHLNVALSSGSKIGALEGLVLYKTPSAAISILIMGTTEKPRIELTSVPPMKREDIIALLIFGKSPDELDPEETASVSNTETALESQAFGLASLYLFGATPIEHVGYDSATKTATVRLRLPGGANLTLGSDFDQSRQLSVRKPLAPHWAIQSELSEQGQQSQQGSGAATYLEWFNRY